LFLFVNISIMACELSAAVTKYSHQVLSYILDQIFYLFFLKLFPTVCQLFANNM